jgi:hypothetical protein
VAVISGATLASGQTSTVPQVAGQVATPVEFTIETVNNEVRCRPPRARLPAQQPIEMRVVNRAERAVMFVAPKFFEAAKHLESAGVALDVAQGGFLAAPESTLRILLITPVAGEYYHSCFQPGQVPSPESSGFITVLDPGR